jgi:hypothetical protein
MLVQPPFTSRIPPQINIGGRANRSTTQSRTLGVARTWPCTGEHEQLRGVQVGQLRPQLAARLKLEPLSIPMPFEAPGLQLMSDWLYRGGTLGDLTLVLKNSEGDPSLILQCPPYPLKPPKRNFCNGFTFLRPGLEATFSINQEDIKNWAEILESLKTLTTSWETKNGTS